MLIALTGYAGAGKSTAAKHLVERHGFTPLKFAGPLKQMMRCLGLGDREIEGDLKEKPHPVLNYKTPRYAMQTIGTEWGRDLIGENLWVNVAMEGANAVLDEGGKVVIDDCRFPNEAAAVRRAGGLVVEILRPGLIPSREHASEGQALDPDRLIINGGTVEDLALRVAQLLEEDRW